MQITYYQRLSEVRRILGIDLSVESCISLQACVVNPYLVSSKLPVSSTLS